MNQITDSIKSEKEYKLLLREALAENKSSKPLPLLLTGLSEGARSAFYVAVTEDWRSKRADGAVLLIVPDEGEAFRASRAIEECGLRVATYPMREFSYRKYTASHTYEYERLSVLNRILTKEVDVVIATPDAALQFTVPAEILERASVNVKVGDILPLEELVVRLNALGYVRVDMVDGCGQFSVRGGICDIFPTQYENPIRIDTFGDEVDRIGTFDVISQRTVEMLDSFSLTPTREIIIEPEARERVIEAIKAQIGKVKESRTVEILEDELNSVREGTDLSFIDKYISVVYTQPETLLDYIGNEYLVVIQESSSVNTRIQSYEFHMKEETEELLKERLIQGAYANYGRWLEEYKIFLESRTVIYCNNFSSGIDRLGGMFNITSRQNVTYRDNYKIFCEDIRHYIENGYRISVMVENETIAWRMSESLREDGIKSVIGGEGERGYPSFVCGINLSGFELNAPKYVCMSLYASAYTPGRLISGRLKKRKSRVTAKEKIMSYAELAVGDYVVHEKHGIGIYKGLSTISVAGTTNDYVCVEYAEGDKLYVPCTQMDSLSKYIGAGSETNLVKISRMNGTAWIKARNKAKASAKEMAKELIALYAERMRRPGIRFDEDDALQREFEAAFEYEETDGQNEAIAEIKADMERPVPMERLLCGDVGYGKTEVALRAAFKAVASGYQVAILVPTTILALQHYRTILSRMRGFPVTVDMVSRFRKPKQQAESLRRVKRGEVDILVGTHRLLSKDVEFKRLGLVIIDEEQRFGVAQKEKLKQLTKDIDVLTLTATPIPRTLNMAMSGIRDMSILEEPPNDRLPVQTYVLEYEEAIIYEAIKKELRRGGQVFYMHNRVEELGVIAGRIAEAVEGAVVAVAHGQMDKEELSDIWHDMVDGKISVLVCTTLIEAGIDVPNANTLIIDDADRYGLAQLHQIRGRVGRSGRRAYAYLSYRKGKELTEIARKRLEAIRDFTEFGSGFRVAMRDLEIRGAGNLLGAEQHGQIETVGYDLYMKLLNEAILEEKGETVKQRTECNVALNVDAYIPEKYVRSTAQRIDAYKKIASIGCEADVSDVRDELIDRYGVPPIQTETLLKVSLLRALGGEYGFSKIELREGNILFYTQSFDLSAWSKLINEFKGRIFFSAGSTPYVTYKFERGADKCDETLELLKKYIQISTEKV
ncbi:MAG: transcription-repair coupling factor [Clostridia bacterium]|nr:transcription-repair coupling factor [Clostridia bacterium]